MLSRPTLPREIENQLPDDVVRHIYSFLPYPRKAPTPKHSPVLQNDLRKLQSAGLKGVKGTYLLGLDDFCLD